MATWFTEARNVELSTIYYLTNQIASNWSGVTVVKSFQQANSASLPVLSVYMSDMNHRYREIGSTALNNSYVIQIDVFADHDGMRLDLTDFVINKLKLGWTYYEWSRGSGEAMTRTETGMVKVATYLGNTRVDVGETVDKYDKNRQSITILVRII